MCPTCGHPTPEHSSEPGVGCLHGWGLEAALRHEVGCPCIEPGTSQADQ